MEVYSGVGEILNLTTIKMDIGQNTQSFSLYASFYILSWEQLPYNKMPRPVADGALYIDSYFTLKSLPLD